MKLNIKGFIVTGLTAVLFIVIAKVVFNKINVPGISNVINAV